MRPEFARLVPDAPGQGLIRWSWYGTALFSVAAILAAAAPALFEFVGLAVALGLFAIGCVLFLWAFAIGVDRSRYEQVNVVGLYLLSESAPAPVRLSLLTSLGIEVVVSIGTAAARPFTSLAFGILVPVYGLAMAGLWGARHGTFERRKQPPAKRKRKSPDHG